MERAPLSPTLNHVVSVFCTRTFPFGFDVAGNAPNTWSEIRDAIAYTGRLSIWEGDFGHLSVFAHDEAWRAFRAWHDYIHVRYDFCFSPEGEWGSAAMQAFLIYRVFGKSPEVIDAVAVALAEQLAPLERDWAGKPPILDRHTWLGATYKSNWSPLAELLARLACGTDLGCLEAARAFGKARATFGAPVH